MNFGGSLAVLRLQICVYYLWSGERQCTLFNLPSTPYNYISSYCLDLPQNHQLIDCHSNKWIAGEQ